MKSTREFFKNKTPEQTFTFCLLIGCVILMLFCAIVRLCGGLWFSADLSQVPLPSQFWQNRINNLLFIFEMTFVYKMLCKTKWIWCILIAIAQTYLIWILPPNNILITGIINLVLYFVIPICFQRKWYTLLDCLFVYLSTLLYGLIFMVGRIGNLDPNATFNFIYGILGAIDYKLFIVSLYLLIKNFGGIKLWKKQKRLICQIDQ